MNILMISDIHLGVKKNSEFFINVTRDFFNDQVIPAIEDNDVEELWILGDLFDDKFLTGVLVYNVAIGIIRKLLWKFKSLKIRILIGNHDIYYKNSLKVTSLKMLDKISKRVEIVSEVSEYDLDGCKCLAVPWLVHGSENWNKFRQVTCDYDESGLMQYDVCFGHFEINGFEKIKGVVENDGMSQDMFKAFGDVFSGHFHIRSKLGNIQYLGCPYEITWNDYGTEKGMTLYDTDSRKATFIKNDTSPKHKHIKLSSVVEDQSLLDDADNNMVRFHLDETIDESDLNAILDKLENKKSFNLQFIDERYDQEIENDDIDLDDVSTDDLKYCTEYAKQLEHPEEIEDNELEQRLISLYQRAIAEIDE